MERWRVTRGGVRSVSGSSSSIIMLRDKDIDHAATANSNVDQQPRYYYNDDSIKQQQQQQLQADADPYSSTTSISVTANQEISIFDAHKYFNQLSINNHIDDQNHKVSDGLSAVSRFSWAAGSPSVSSVDDTTSINGRNINYPLRLRARSFHVVAASATPTASSEASWNSQTGLLSNPRHAATATNGNVAFMASLRSRTSTNPPPPHPHHDDRQIINKKKLRVSSRWLTALPRRPPRCPCSGKKSVQVVAQETKSSISSSSVVGVGGGDIYNIKMPGQIILTKDKIPPAAPTASVVTTANLNYSMARPRDHNRHVLWGEERRRNWDRQVNNTTINMQPAANSTNSTTGGCISTTAAGGGFSFPILKFHGDGGTSLPSATTSIQKPSHSITDRVQCGLLIGDFNKDEDVGSDASSDLFEIESFSTSTTQTLQAASADVPTYSPPSSSMLFQNYYRTRRDSFSVVEDAVSCTATRRLSLNNNSLRTSLDRHQHDPPMTPLSTDQYCYEPSEASIDWSVTTADGFDRSDQYDHDHPDHPDDADLGTKVVMSSKRRPPSLGSNNNNMGLLSCRREKAVSVGPNPVRLVAMAAAPADHDYCQSRHRGVGVGPTTLSVCSKSRPMMHVGSRPAVLARQ